MQNIVTETLNQNVLKFWRCRVPVTARNYFTFSDCVLQHRLFFVMQNTETQALLPNNSKQDAGQSNQTAHDLERYFQTIKKDPETGQDIMTLNLEEGYTFVELMQQLQTMIGMSNDVFWAIQANGEDEQKLDGVRSVLRHTSRVFSSLESEMELLDKIREENGI